MSNQDPRCPRHRHLHPTSTCSLHKHKGSENDAVIARVLQEELSQAEAYRRAAGPECSHGQGNKAGCFRAPSHCCHHTGSSHAESSLNSMKVKDDESRLDGEVRKRIHQMDRIPHVPRINSRIPSADEATSDHQRLLNRLELYNLDELKVSGDGNCQFRSLSDQLYRSPEHHKAVRQQVVDQLRAHPELYAPYVPMPYHEYIMIISKLGEWGDHVTLQAAADWYGVMIFVLTSYKDTCYIEILPRLQKSKRGSATASLSNHIHLYFKLTCLSNMMELFFLASGLRSTTTPYIQEENWAGIKESTPEQRYGGKGQSKFKHLTGLLAGKISAKESPK